MNDSIFDILEAIPAVEPDDWDREMLAEIEERRAKGEEEFIPFSDLMKNMTEERTKRAAAIEKENGKMNIRIPKSLQHDLKTEAEREGVSLNQYVLYILSSRDTLPVI